jgi:hypothetical protein
VFIEDIPALFVVLTDIRLNKYYMYIHQDAMYKEYNKETFYEDEQATYRP